MIYTHVLNRGGKGVRSPSIHRAVVEPHSENAALALGRKGLGKIEVGARADFVVVDSAHALEALYRWGHLPIHSVFVAGALAL